MDSFRESMDSFHFVITNPDSKKVRFVITNPGFVSYRGSRIQPFSKDSFRDAIFKRFDESYESSQILSTIDLRIHTNPVLPDSRIPTVFKRFVSWIRFVLRCWKDSFRGFVSCSNFQKIRFVDSFRGFVSWRNFQKIRFVDSIRKTKNLKRFDLFRFVRIRIRIPHP